MISSNPEWNDFVLSHRWAVLTTLRAEGSPVSSVVAYAVDGDELVVSTRKPTFKCVSARRDGRVNLCVLSNQEPFNYVAVEGRCKVEHEELVRSTRLIFRNIEGTGYDEPEDLQGWLDEEQRVIFRISPQRVYGVIR